MAIQKAQPSTSIYMTFKIFQLINQLRRRFKPRVQSDRTKPDTSLGPKTRLGLEDDAFRGFEKCLPVRASGLESSKYRNAHDRTSALYDKPITSDLRDEGPASSRSTPAQGNLEPCSAPELQVWHSNY